MEALMSIMLQPSNIKSCISIFLYSVYTEATSMQQLQKVTREKDHDIEIREQQLQQLNQQLTASQQVTAQLEETIQESQEEKKHLQQQLDKVLQQSMVIQKGKTNVVVIIGASLSNFHTSKSLSLYFFLFFFLHTGYSVGSGHVC